MSPYIEAGRLGLKSVAIYREGSKRSAPLNTRKTKDWELQPLALTSAGQPELKP